jgi:hypothetical protein
MKKRVVIAMIASMAFAVTAWGAETEYSGTLCGISKRNVLYSTSDLTVLSLETWGIQPSESTFEPWKNASVHCVGYGRITQGKLSSTGSCLWTDPTGDIFIGEFQAVRISLASGPSCRAPASGRESRAAVSFTL